jgi:hypothetical protein
MTPSPEPPNVVPTGSVQQARIISKRFVFSRSAFCESGGVVKGMVQSRWLWGPDAPRGAQEWERYQNRR